MNPNVFLCNVPGFEKKQKQTNHPNQNRKKENKNQESEESK